MGSTSQVYLAQALDEPSRKVAIKIYKSEFLLEAGLSPSPIEQVSREIRILKSLDHPNINKIIEHGDQGTL